ncbi:uncharacterized protein EURHEDRAFT_240995 [Aspergillus ruber CBS 135680]|uniref:Uncharacterized protein n=1 Tax=Aspergillus ruber (strain CBS 135680) TaxID=1388766 RepID=A0A017S379_ASPRC|nr:uncharacterized protein EURHEDRAFT_240995 [Aspergillus ruber CBS 135680]EYE91483.1 hypothetical protein EURHEDRAFT_240995 [Aspergillus ruber CBS 135680]
MLSKSRCNYRAMACVSRLNPFSKISCFFLVESLVLFVFCSIFLWGVSFDVFMVVLLPWGFFEDFH